MPLTGKEVEELTAVVAGWGAEAGLLGLEGHLDGRLGALVREASVRIFGNCDAERDSLLCRVEGLQKEIEDLGHQAEECSQARKAARGALESVSSWTAERRQKKRDSAERRRIEPELRKLHLDFERAESVCRNAGEWREMASQALRSAYRYHEARAALVRPEVLRQQKFTEQENGNDSRNNNRQFVVHRAN